MGQTILNVILDRLKQPTSIAGLLGLLSFFGVHLVVSPEMTTAIQGFIVATISLGAVVYNENKKKSK